MGATIKPHPVFDTVKGAAVATYLPVGSAAAPAYFDVGALQRIGPIPATNARRKTPIKFTTCTASTAHPGWRMPLAISPPSPSPRLFLCARSGAQEQKSPESSTPCNQNRALKARKQRFLTTVHTAAARTSSGISLQDLAPEAEDVAMQDLTLLALLACDPAGAAGVTLLARLGEGAGQNL